MTNKTYSKEEQFLRELAQVCKKHNVGLSADKILGIYTLGELDIIGILFLADGRYAACTRGEMVDIVGEVK